MALIWPSHTAQGGVPHDFGYSRITDTYLPIFWPTDMQANWVSSSVSVPQTNFIWASLIRRPTQSWARKVIDEISEMVSDELVEARIVPGRQTLSSRVKISSLDSNSSGTHSIARSASRAACSTVEANSIFAKAASAASLLKRPSVIAERSVF